MSVRRVDEPDDLAVTHKYMATMTGADQISKKPTILIVDDEAGPRDALKVILRPLFHIRSAENAKTALAILSQEPIDLVTLDQRLPDCQGIELLQDIRQKYPEIQVIIITGYGSLKSAMEGIRHGAAGYLLKPFNVTELTTLINQTLEKKKRLAFLQHAIATSPDLLESGHRSVQAWQTIQSGYALFETQSPRGASNTQNEIDLLPLVSDLLEARDKQLLNHSSRVSLYAPLLASRLNLSVVDQKLLAMGAFLHDIGKICLPAHKHSESDTLASPDTTLYREHPERGAQITLALGFPEEISQLVLFHHERWDGQGFPRGLRGEHIPRLARVISIAETFDHLITDTPGGTPVSVELALRQLTSQAQTYFDPTLLPIFIDVIKDYTPSLSTMAMAAAA